MTLGFFTAESAENAEMNGVNISPLFRIDLRESGTVAAIWVSTRAGGHARVYFTAETAEGQR